MYVTSRYNFSVAGANVVALFNARTGALLRISGRDRDEIAEALCTWPAQIDTALLPDSLLTQLVDGGFLVIDGTDELAAIASTFARARTDTPMVLTIATTMDCNLGCYYCYEERSSDTLTLADVSAIVAHAERRLVASGLESLHVDWYGGEPMLNVDFIEECSTALQRMCARRGVAYHASIISNGTAWPDDVGAFIARHRIRQVQISFDGLQENHDKRRRYRRGRAPHGSSSFEACWSVVDRLLDHVRVDVRFNIDRDNAGDVLPFLDRAEAAGWFSRKFPAVFQPARLAAYSERSDFMRDAGLDLATFDELRARVRERSRGRFLVEESEAPDGLPEPRTSVCAALANNSDVIGADRKLYRCGLQVGEADRATDALDGTSVEAPDRAFWNTFDPTTQPQCSRCSFLPLCWGGCPKKHLENDLHALSEQSLYWRRNLPRLIARAAGFEAEIEPYDEAQQFRDGYRPPAPPRKHKRLPVVHG